MNIANHCIVGAGSVVTRSCYETGKILAGNPARIIGNVEDIKHRKEDFRFDFRGMSFHEKKAKILENEYKWVQR